MESSKPLDWKEAERYLQTAERVYSEAGMSASFAVMFVILPLRVRFNNGERTPELHTEIMEIAL